jgi:hypothetical protein
MRTVERRLAQVEAALTPTELVVRWLADAQTYDDFTTYTRSLVQTEPPTFPLDCLAHEAEAAARQQTRGLPREEAQAAIRQAIVGTVFRVQLVLQIYILAQEFLDREALIQAALSAHLALAIEADDRHSERATLPIAKCRDLLVGRVSELHAMEAARLEVERRYLNGIATLFSARQRAWDVQRTESERGALIAIRLAEFDGAEPLTDDDPVAVEARVAQLVADHVEHARLKAYDELGDGRRAVNIAVRWLRPRILAEDPVIRGA